MQSGKHGAERMLDIYKNKNVFITGNTGFKGSWLTAIFKQLNINVEGYANAPESVPNHFNLLKSDCKTTIANILDRDKLYQSMQLAKPTIVFHLAAQALVRSSYHNPVDTYETNVIGTLNVLEAARKCGTVKALVLVTTDKVYENKEIDKPYSETDELGGYDMYSSSKACCEILIKSYRNSFFNAAEYGTKHETLIASARAGNVIGGGDWSTDRLLPDIARATAEGKKVNIRNPNAVRPWQHVLDCLYGYIQLGSKLLANDAAFAEAWNFSPYSTEVKNVKDIVSIAKKNWVNIDVDFESPSTGLHEANLLILDNTKAVQKLNWKPIWNTEEAVKETIDWYKNYYNEHVVLTNDQISAYLKKIPIEI